MTALLLLALLLACLARLIDDGRDVRPPSVRRAAAFFLLCAILGTIPRAWAMDRSLWLDEYGTLWAVERGLSESVMRVMEFHGQSPLYYVLVWAFVHAFGESEIVLRIPSLLFGIGTAVFTGMAAALVSGRAAGFFAGGLVWVSQSLTGASVNARPYALGMLCASVALYGFVGAVRFGTWRYRLTFALAAAALALTHYLYGLLLAGITLGYAVHPPLRTIYPWKSFARDLAVIALLCSIGAPQVLALWQRRTALVWTDRPDLMGLARTLFPFAVAAMLALSRVGDPTRRAVQQTLALSVMIVIGILWSASVRGITLLIPRYFEVVVVPAVILASIGLVQNGGISRVLGLAFAALLTTTSLVGAFAVTGQFTAATVPHEDWRAAVSALERAQQQEPGPVVLQSGFVEQVDDRVDRDSAVLAPLRPPGRPRPDWDLRVLPYVWDSARADAVRETLTPLLERSPQVYFLGGGGYAARFKEWVAGRLAPAITCARLGSYADVEVLACRGTRPAQSAAYGSSGAK